MRPLSHLAPAALMLAAVFAACSKSDASKSGGDSASPAASSDTTAPGGDAPATTRLALPVAAIEVREGDLVLTVTTTGQVRSEGESLLRTEVAGIVERVSVRPGDRVKKGQPLVSFEVKPLELAIAEAEANVDAARVRYRDTYYPDSVVTGKAPTEEQRRTAMARSGLPGALVALERSKFERAKATVYAPFDGMVDRVDVSAGVRVSPGDALTRVVNITDLRVEASVLEHDLPLIKEGGEAIVTSAAARDRPIRGRIAAVLPMVDTVSRSGRAFVRIAANSALRPGMYADVQLEATRLAKRILVPTRAIIQRDGRPLVFVVKDGRAQWVYINPGRSNGQETEVLPDSGTGLIPVSIGDQVVVEGHLTLTHDAPVKVVNADTSVSRGVKREE